MKTITIQELENTFQGIEKDVDCLKLIYSSPLMYEVIEGDKKEHLVSLILQKIEHDNYNVGSKEIWDKNWEKVYQKFMEANCNLNALIPKFITKNESCPLRYHNNFIQSSIGTFWIDYYSIFRRWLYKAFLSDTNYIYEFGCGTGYNLVELAQLYNNTKELHGLDFSQSSVKIIDKISTVYKYNIEGHLFDMRNPSQDFELKNNCAVITMNSIEQLGEQYHSFIDYLLKQTGISMCIHVEPTIEFHDFNNSLDWLSLKFMKKRNYSLTLLTHLTKLQSENKIKIIEAKRVPFGNLMSNCYTYIVWKPIQGNTK